MTFNDTTTKLGIIQACEDYCGLGLAGISGDTNKLYEFTRYANRASRKIWHWIFTAQGTWQYDDSNQTDLPQGTANLVSGTATYALPAEALTVNRLEILSSDAQWYQLTQLTENEIPSAIGEFLDADSTPLYYRLLGNTIELFPAPNYASTNGLKVYFDRDISNFTYSDTTKTPGFASPYHDLVAIGASLEWLKAKRPDSNTLAHLRDDWAKGEVEVSKFYAQRNKDKTSVLARGDRRSYR